MKNLYPKVSLGRFCRLLGITRQAYYQHFWYREQLSFEEDLIVSEVHKIRKNHRHMGGRKLYELLQPFLLAHQIKMGRDRLFDVLSAHHLLVRRQKKQTITTNSFHRFKKYSNLIRDFVPVKPNQLWVSDITYWKLETGFVYISIITDAYSRKIVGYHLADSLQTSETIQALLLAIDSLPKDREGKSAPIHHSDRGTQYCSNEYVKLLQAINIEISMTENGDPLENAIAERVNGIIKEEYLNDYAIGNIKEARGLLATVVNLYNQERPHMSIGNLTPDHVHQNDIKTEKLWKNYYTKSPIIVN
ncbi:IS3 family transposase [Tamlana sp. 2_MG-2023]|uniref:IS3 family transposase n=1 Tax=unclassified Tamlana TaxID=2614803 RepID=UPI0026E1DAF7|nr:MULTISPECIES: IS3 family transposase [unclassified Tamlana]MDO6760033.1 IS3 family transposase [Tamlana sp. 2_MG-2023]MDO6790269.1 IS3 family transposase [Tamlana sp. 1_MG-2023]